MNSKKISNLKHKHVRIRPIPLRFDVAGNRLPPSDHNWLVLDATRHGAVIENAGYGHRLTLGPDQIHDFRTDPSGMSFGFLNLNGQLWVRGNAAGVEPLPYRIGLEWDSPAFVPAPAPQRLIACIAFLRCIAVGYCGLMLRDTGY